MNRQTAERDLERFTTDALILFLRRDPRIAFNIISGHYMRRDGTCHHQGARRPPEWPCWMFNTAQRAITTPLVPRPRGPLFGETR